MNVPDELTVTHPVFGKLGWEPERAVWFTQIRDATGEWVDVSIEPDENDRHACLDRAADLYSRAMAMEHQLLRLAIERELLALYNECWRESGWPALDAASLIGHFTFTFIQVRPGREAAVILNYDAGELFAGHSVDVNLDGDLHYQNATLVG